MTALAGHMGMLAVGGGSNPGAYVAAILALSPTGFWKLDETSGTTAVATSGGINGTYEGTDLILNDAAIIPSDSTLRCPRFTTSPQNSIVSAATNTTWSRVTIGTSADLRPASGFTYQVVFRPNSIASITNGQMIISHGGAGFAFRHSAAANGNLEVLKSQQASRLSYSAGFAAGQSYHLALRVRSTGVLTAHINGVLVATGTTASDYGSPVRPLRIGVDAQLAADNLQGPFSGWISCPALLPELSDAQILGLAQAAGF